MDNKNKISDVEKMNGLKFSELYSSFLEKIPENEVFEIENTGICLYSFSELTERNETYEIKEYDPNFFMIGQEGDRGYFINAKDPMDETVYINDLGAIGSLAMVKEAENILELIGKK
jgi:hypothetical protein